MSSRYDYDDEYREAVQEQFLLDNGGREGDLRKQNLRNSEEKLAAEQEAKIAEQEAKIAEELLEVERKVAVELRLEVAMEIKRKAALEIERKAALDAKLAFWIPRVFWTLICIAILGYFLRTRIGVSCTSSQEGSSVSNKVCH